jgi:hypothetical protein
MTLRFMSCRIPASRQVETLPRKSSRAELEAQLTEARARLQLTHRDTDGIRLAMLVRYGSFEVRLFQPLQISPERAVLFWLELFDHDRRLSIDSIGNCVLEDAVTAAEDLIERAARLSENPHSWRRST